MKKYCPNDKQWEFLTAGTQYKGWQMTLATEHSIKGMFCFVFAVCNGLPLFEVKLFSELKSPSSETLYQTD